LGAREGSRRQQRGEAIIGGDGEVDGRGHHFSLFKEEYAQIGQTVFSEFAAARAAKQGIKSLRRQEGPEAE
jgi:hypothetical protein